ncbi:diguanylate cyclase domain-containing protein [Paraburkholderia mimosarum]|uniref:diguanylate cyclase domain-containing protein n=1 Tax=Paraburkholderia mimosarum TaxID=312026 RepID=UPI0003FE98F3
MYRAPDKAALLARLPEVFRDDMPHRVAAGFMGGRLFQHREAVNYALAGTGLPDLSFSIGYSSCAEGENVEAMLREADAAMYEAKRHRNETSLKSMETEVQMTPDA